MRYKTGRYTTGATLILIGVAILLHQITNTNWLSIILKLWPLVIIGYGVEYLIATRNPERPRFDVGGAIFTLLLVGLIAVYSTFGGLIFHITDLKHATPAAPIQFAEGEVTSINVHGLFGEIVVEPSEDGKVTILPTYRSYDERTLEKMVEEVGLTTTLNRGMLDIYGHKLIKASGKVNFFGLKNTSVDLVIKAPADLPLEIDHTFGSVEVRGMENLRSTKLNFGEVVIRDSKGDLHTSVDFGSLKISNFDGALNADVSFGEAEIDGDIRVKWDVSVDFGEVVLTLDKNSSFRYQFDVDLGSRDVPFENKEYGTVNGGNDTLRADVSFGSIALRLK